MNIELKTDFDCIYERVDYLPIYKMDITGNKTTTQPIISLNVISKEK